MLEQALAPSRSHGGDLLEARSGARLAAPGAVPGDRAAMRLVAHLLDEVQRGMVGRKAPRLLFTRDEELLHPRLALHALRDADHADVVQPQVGHHGTRGIELPDAAVDEDEVRRLAL